MPDLNKLLETAAKADPLVLAIFFIGVTSLGAIWLAWFAIASLRRDGKK